METAPGDPRPATTIDPPEDDVASPPAPRPEYEFNEAEDRIIQDLGHRMSFVGLFMVGIGLCFAVSAVQRWTRFLEIEVGFLLLTMLFAVFGVWTHRAGREFVQVAESRGRDVSHLMSALSTMLSCYRLVYLIFLVGLIFAVIQLAATHLGG